MVPIILMKLLVVTTRKDRSRNRLTEEARGKGIEVSQLYYENLGTKNLKSEYFRDYDFCILRDPYNIGKDFSETMKRIMSFFKESQILDCRVYQKHPRYEDKLFQHILFKDTMKMPRFWHYTNTEEIDTPLPVIVKRRISSRGRDVFMIKTENEINRFFKENDIGDYLFEELMKIKRDIRVLVIGNEVIGAVDRKFRVKNNKGYDGIGVKVRNEYRLSEDMKKMVIEIARKMESDFCGIDFIIDENDQIYLLECNISPQFVAFENALEVNVAERVIDAIVSQKKD